MSTFATSKTIQDLWGAPLTNLSLQKLLYLSHMVHLGEGHGGLATNRFQAWDYGPIEPELYHKLKAYGSRPFPASILPAASYEEGTAERHSIETVTSQLRGASPRKLVAITHWPEGAWAKHYHPGARGVVIPDNDILAEFNARSTPRAA